MRVTEDTFLGAVLGSAIGDALGAPFAGKSAADIEREFGVIDGYKPVTLADGVRLDAGEITDETEINLCIIESLTTNDGFIDPDNISARLIHLARGHSRHWMTDRTAEGIEVAHDHGGLVPVDGTEEFDSTVLMRGVPAGLLHALGAFDVAALDADARLLARLSHGATKTANLTAAVARAVRAIAAAPDKPDDWHGAVLTGLGEGGAAPIMATLDAVARADVFESPVFAAVSMGGRADTNGALAGAFAGTRFGASGIPQRLIDDLGARIYISLAVTWFYRAAMRRAGAVIDLREI